MNKRKLIPFLCTLLATILILVGCSSLHDRPLSGADLYLSKLAKVEALSKDTTYKPTSPAGDSTADAQVPLLVAHREVAELIVVKAAIATIYFAEGTYPNAKELNPYDIIFGYHTRQEFGLDYSDHYRQCIPFGTKGLCSDASGSCQSVSDINWDPNHKKYPDIWFTNVPAFHPKNQDKNCAISLAEGGGYEILIAGMSVTPSGKIAMEEAKFVEAIATLCRMWASFPCEDGRGYYDTEEYNWQKAKPIEDLWHQFLVSLEAEESRLFSPQSIAVAPIAQPADQFVAVSPEGKLNPVLMKRLELGDLIAGNPVTSPFGNRIHPVDGVERHHDGADIGTKFGTPVLAPLPGAVTCHDQGRWGTFALFVFADMPDRSFVLHHLSQCIEGEWAIGDKFGETGEAGTGPHLHLQAQELVGGDWYPYDFPAIWAWGFLKGKLIQEAFEA